MAKRQAKREWADALEKVHREGRCRVCGYERDLEAAHVIGREHDTQITGPRGGVTLYVHPDSVVPLCGALSPKACHIAYDAHEIDLLPYLKPHEQERAVMEAGGIIAALTRVTGGKA